MQALQPYLFFNGRCREAMDFYAGAFGARLHMMTYAEGPEAPAEGGDRIMHAAMITSRGPVLMASDTPVAQPVTEGQNFDISIDCDSREEADRLFPALAAGGEVRLPLQPTFWGAYFGMLRDRFGVGWMLNHTEPHD